MHASAAAKPAPGEGSATHIKEPFVFSVGSRDCIGQALARLELQVRSKEGKLNGTAVEWSLANCQQGCAAAPHAGKQRSLSIQACEAPC